jgi:Zn-dependent metalloprotease
MKKLLFILMSFPFLVLAQSKQNNNQDVSNELRVEIKDGSVSLRLQGKEIKHEKLVSDFNLLLKLNKDHSFKDVSERTDDLGYTHFNYKQYYKGIEIDGGLLMVHSKNGLVTSINGKVAEFDNLDIQSAISEGEAQQFAKTSLKVTSLSKEYAIKKLIYWNKGKGEQEPCLAYKVRIESSSPFVKYNVFVDAKTGRIINKISLIANGDVTGIVTTNYNGDKLITMDSIGQYVYLLRDNERNIETYDLSEPVPQGASYTPIASSSKGIPSRAGTWTFNMYDSYGDGWEGATVDIIVGPNTVNNVTLSSGFSGTQTFEVEEGRDSIYIGFWKPGSTDSEISWELIAPAFGSVASGDWGSTENIYGKHDNGEHVLNCAGSVHWAMEETYDYFKNIHSRDSYNDSGAVIQAGINPPHMQLKEGGNPNNAQAGGGGMWFGIGDGSFMDYLVSLDIVGHEFTHNVIGFNGNGGLDYQSESGALNESFADIFGTCIEHYSYNSITNTSGKTPNWLLAEDVMIMHPSLRSMENPKLSGPGGSPDTYGGQYWHDYTLPGQDTIDHGGVHTNSGVQNKWFYLLSDGGYGVNDNNYSYNVTGIGMADAAKIAYRNVIYHLTPNATYQDAYEGSVQSAIELFGISSPQYYSVITAWNAVGVFGAQIPGCMDPSACNYNAAATVDDGSCDFSCYGCTDPLANNYDPLATIDDGSCTYTVAVYGCIDELACNYDVNATTDDASCYYSILATIDQNGDNLYAATTPANLEADWYNTQTKDSTTRVWLMEEDTPLFTPTFECTYYIKVEVGNCIVTSEPYYFGATAKRIGSLVVSPNPTTDKINVKFENEKNQYVYLHLMNSNGVKLDDFITKNTELDIDISKYPSGIYYLYFDSSDSKQGCNPEDVEMISTKIILNK